ncbi:histidine kinase [Spirosoma flavus]
MTRFVEKLILQAGFTVTVRQFWRYALVFWSALALVSYAQHTILWLLGLSRQMHFSESLHWLIVYVSWLGFTPVILYAGQRFPVRFSCSDRSWLKGVAAHVLLSSGFGFFVSLIAFGLLRPIHAYETGEWLGTKSILIWFFYEYSLTITTYLLVVVGYSIVVYSRQNQALHQQNLTYELNNEQLKTQLANAQLQSLKMQLNPHFLFNTHHAIVSLMMQNETHKAIDMVTALSDLLRGVLVQQDTNFITLHDELMLTQKYLAIQEIRFQDRLRIDYAIDPATEQCRVPQLLLQPLVENAITHGIADLTHNALIRISTQKQPGKLLITIYDNGVGKRSKRSDGTGLGLTNTRLRLQQAYGVNAHLEISQPPVGGTAVTLSFPCKAKLETVAAYDNVSLAYH